MDYEKDKQATEKGPAVAGGALSASEDAALARKLCQQYKEAKKHWAPVKERMHTARKFYAGEQWTREQLEQLKEENRPAIVINQVFKAVNNLSGRQRDSRLAYKALPKGADDILAAAGCTRGLAYIEDANKSKFTESETFMDALFGVGWGRVSFDDTDPTREEVRFERLNPDEVLADPFGRQKDLSDFRYIIIEREVDLDVALEAFPEQAEAIREAARQAEEDGDYEQRLGDYGNRGDGRPHSGRTLTGPAEPTDRERVTLREHHYWKMESVEYAVLPNGDKLDIEDTTDPMMLAAAGAEVKTGKRKCFYITMMAGDKVLESTKSDNPFNRFPIVQLRGFTDQNGMPYGVVDPMIWPQKELNVNRSRVNESIRSRGLIVGDGALGHTSLDDLARNLAKANFAVKVDDPNKIQIVTDQANIGAYANLMETSRREIDDVAGLNEAAYGDNGNEKSGKAIQARIQQQSQTLGELFDNWRFFRLQVGEMKLALALKHWKPQKWARIIEQSVIADHAGQVGEAVNRGGQAPQLALDWIRDAVAGINSFLRLDVKLEDQAETTTERQATMQQAIELVGLLPDLAKVAIAPDIIRMSDFEGKEEMAQKAESAMMPPTPPPMSMAGPQVPMEGMPMAEGPMPLPGPSMPLPGVPGALPPVA